MLQVFSVQFKFYGIKIDELLLVFLCSWVNGANIPRKKPGVTNTEFIFFYFFFLFFFFFNLTFIFIGFLHS